MSRYRSVCPWLLNNECIWRRNRESESQWPDGLGGWSHEKYLQPGRRNCSPRIGLWGGCGMRILEEFWYGNIEPTEYDTSSCKEYKKLLELICRNEENFEPPWRTSRRNCLRSTQIASRSIRPLLIAWCFRKALSWAPGWWLRLWKIKT